MDDIMDRSTKDAYVEKAKAKLDQWNAEIDRLAAKAARGKADATIEYQNKMADLRRKRDAMNAEVQRLQKAGTGAWGDVKAGVEVAWEALGEAIDSARARF